MRLRPEQHLRRQSDIRAPREQGTRVDCQAYTAWFLQREGVPAGALPRVCVVASAAAVGGAVQRNRAKRRLRDVFRRHQNLPPPGCDIVLVARAAATRWPYPALERKFVEACRRLTPSAAR